MACKSVKVPSAIMEISFPWSDLRARDEKNYMRNEFEKKNNNNEDGQSTGICENLGLEKCMKKRMAVLT